MEEIFLKERETFGSRLGFILVSAGCAVGLGNVWKFPYMTGKYGGAAFILIYLAFLVLLGLPILVSEFAVGRSSRLSTARAFHKLEPEGSNFHKYSYMGMIGNYMLMMFYTMVAGWMMYYCYVMATGKLSGASSDEVSGFFSNLMTSTGTMTGWMIVAVLLAFGVCSLGLQNGIERITKVMMICLLVLIVVLAVHSVTLDGAMEGVKFYLVPNLDNIRAAGLGNVIFGALSQAFFTLSIGIGAMEIFGSYMGKECTLAGESINILILDTFVALMAGLIIIPACFAFNVEPGAGPGLVFITLPNVFNQMAGGRLWGALFSCLCPLRHCLRLLQYLRTFCPSQWIYGAGNVIKQFYLISFCSLFFPCRQFLASDHGPEFRSSVKEQISWIWKILLFQITSCHLVQ